MKDKYPFTKQDGLKNCACACIQMMVKYYKGFVSMGELEERLKTNKLGTNAFEMKEVLEELGFICEGYKLDSLKDNMVFPLIAHVTIESKYNHFIVIYGIHKNKVIVADPADKVKKMQLDDFYKIWDGIILTAHPIKPIPRNEEVKLSSYIKDSLFNYKKELIIMMMLSVIYMIFTVLVSFNIKIFFDMISENKDVLFIIFSLFLNINVFKILSNFFRTRLLIFMNQKIDISMNMDIYKKVINLPYQYFRNRTSGEIISKIVDLSNIRELINNLIFIALFDLPLTIISGVILFHFSSKLFIYSLFILFIYLTIYKCSRLIIKKRTNICLKEKADVSSYLFESISGFESVKNLNIEKKTINKYDNKYSSYLKSIVKLDKFMNIQNLFKSLNDEIGQLIILYLGILLVKDGKLLLSNYLAFNSLSVFFFSPMRNILSLDLSLEQASSAFKKAFEIVTSKDRKGIKTKNVNTIKFNNLSFSYHYNDILSNISLCINKGEKVLITGKSGAGKSTLLKLLLKYYDIERNMIYLNNTDLNDIKDTRSIFTYVSQNETLFTDSIYNNINIFNKDTDSFSEVVNLCKVSDVIKDSNLGLNMIIEENGFNISGGQKQRIVLARALLSNFEILLVDEGLSQVDISLERTIIKNIFNKYKDKTMIFISHRLENLDLYDRLIEIKDGKIFKDVKRV